MNCIKTAREIGLFEAARNNAFAADSQDVRAKVEETMPMPDANFEKHLQGAVDFLMQTGKRKFLFLSPEIALLEAIASTEDWDPEIFIVIPTDMDPESRERLTHNLPHGIRVQLMSEPYFPDDFSPSNGLIVVFGYTADSHLMVLQESIRLNNHYDAVFWRRKAFIPYVLCRDPVRFPQWRELNPNKFMVYGGMTHEES